MKSAPFWFQLVYNWCLNGRTGLTLPFIVGADARARKAHPIADDVRRILDEIRRFENADGSVLLQFCPDRGALVFSANPFRGGKFRIDERLLAGGTDEQLLIDQLAQHTAMLVQRGDFSRVGDPPEWAPFEESDLEFIDGVIGKSEMSGR